MSKLRVLFFGDVVGAPGRVIFQKHISALRTKYKADAVLVNGENSAGGRGITSRVMHFFRHNGVDVVTSGNHIWRHKEIYNYLREHTDLLRPANFPSGCPGVGVTTFQCKGITIGVMNLQGQVFMHEQVENPFRAAESILTYLRHKTNIILVDFHAETTSEKIALGLFLDGKVSAVVGTHTHVQTADERVLRHGTAFISDLGMAGALNSSLGMMPGPIIERFLTQMPVKFEVDVTPPYLLCGVMIEIDGSTGKATAIERIRIVDKDISVSADEIGD